MTNDWIWPLIIYLIIFDLLFTLYYLFFLLLSFGGLRRSCWEILFDRSPPARIGSRLYFTFKIRILTSFLYYAAFRTHLKKLVQRHVLTVYVTLHNNWNAEMVELNYFFSFTNQQVNADESAKSYSNKGSWLSSFTMNNSCFLKQLFKIFESHSWGRV